MTSTPLAPLGQAAEIYLVDEFAELNDLTYVARRIERTENCKAADRRKVLHALLNPVDIVADLLRRARTVHRGRVAHLDPAHACLTLVDPPELWAGYDQPTHEAASLLVEALRSGRASDADVGMALGTAHWAARIVHGVIGKRLRLIKSVTGLEPPEERDWYGDDLKDRLADVGLGRVQ